MVSTISAKRKNDAVLAVCQDNHKNTVKIEDANSVFEQMTGYKSAELQGMDLQIILPDDIKDLISSYVEFNEGGNDLASVLRKVMNFRILGKNGDSVDVFLKVFYVVSSDAMHPRYELLIRDVTILRRISDLKESLSTMKIDVNTDLEEVKISTINTQDVNSDLQRIYEFAVESTFPISFSVVKFDEYEICKEKCGKKAADQIKLRIIQAIATTIREKDLVGVLTEGYMCVALFDCDSVDAKNVFARVRSAIVRKNIAFQETVDADARPVQLHIRFAQIDKKFTITQLKDALIDSIDNSSTENVESVVL